MKAGQTIEIPGSTPHALYCDPVDGLQFHELVGTGEEAFQKRTTTFLMNQGFEMATDA